MVAPARPIPSRGPAANALAAALDAFFAGGLVLRLPFPPSVNHYWEQNANGRRRVGDRGITFRIETLAAYRIQAESHRQLEGRLAVRLTVYPPDRIRRDLDNVKKAIFDACTHARVWGDDNQIDEDYTKRGPVTKGGYIKLEVVEL